MDEYEDDLVEFDANVFFRLHEPVNNIFFGSE